MSPASSQPPTVYVIAGPNGAGKTTFALEFLPDFVQCRKFLSADLIAAGLSPFAPESQNVPAGRLLLERIEQLTDKGRLRVRDDLGRQGLCQTAPRNETAGLSVGPLLSRTSECGHGRLSCGESGASRWAQRPGNGHSQTV